MPETDPRLQWLLDAIRAEARMTRNYTGTEAFSDRVMQALARVPRHRFVPTHLQSRAYENNPLPIGHGQTISQPYIVALMTELLAPAEDARILEVGTGCGYQTAVLAELAGQVYSLEVVEALATEAATRLRELGYKNVETRLGDGYAGWAEQAPFDGIIVTAAAPYVPPALVEQLKPGGRLVIPVARGVGQELMLICKHADGATESREVLPVAFVPLVRKGES